MRAYISKKVIEMRINLRDGVKSPRVARDVERGNGQSI